MKCTALYINIKFIQDIQGLLGRAKCGLEDRILNNVI